MPSGTEPALQSQAREILVRRRWWIVTLLFFAGLINYFDRTIVSVALTDIAADLHLGPERMGILLSAFFWSYALMQIPIGSLSDRFNLRWLYAACFALWSLTCGLTSFAAGLAVMLVLRVLLGIGESIYLPGGIKLVSILFPAKDRGLASGLMNCGTRAGLAFGAPLIAALVTAYGWKNAFFLLGFTATVWLAPWLAVFPRGANTARYGEPKPAAAGRGRISRNLAAISLSNVGYGYYFYLLVTWLPAYLVQSRHLTLKAAGVCAAIPYLTFALGEPVGGWIADRLIAAGWDESFSRKVVITAAYFSSLLLIPAGLVGSTATAVALIAGASLVGLSTGNLYALVQRVSPEGDVGFSICWTSGKASVTIGPGGGRWRQNIFYEEGRMSRIGVLYGMEESFPPALVNHINAMGVNGVTAEHLKVGGVRMADPSGYEVIIDRISHDIPFYRSFLKNAALNGTKIINNPFWWSADDKFFNYALATKIGVAIPPTVLLPHKSHPPGTTDRSMRNLEFPLDWDGIFQYVGFPAFLKPHDGGGWKSVYHVHNPEEFFRAYEESGTLCMTLQGAVRFQEYFRCYVVNREKVHVMRYDPGQPHHLRYVPGNPPPERALGERMVGDALNLCRALGYDLNTVEFAVEDGVPYAIDFMNPAPDAGLESVGADHFRWIVDAVAEMAVERAQESREAPREYHWSKFLTQASAAGGRS